MHTHAPLYLNYLCLQISAQTQLALLLTSLLLLPHSQVGAPFACPQVQLLVCCCPFASSSQGLLLQAPAHLHLPLFLHLHMISMVGYKAALYKQVLHVQ